MAGAKRKWSGRDLNPRPRPCQGRDLPTDLPPLKEGASHQGGSRKPADLGPVYERYGFKSRRPPAIVDVRRAEPQDADALAAIAQASVLDIRTGQPPGVVQHWAKQLHPERLAEIIHEQWVVCTDQGFASLEGDDLLGTLYVHPEAQGRGLARQLVRAVAAEAERRGADVLHVDASLNAFEVYLAMGFIDDGIEDKEKDGVHWKEHRMHASVASLLA